MASGRKSTVVIDDNRECGHLFFADQPTSSTGIPTIKHIHNIIKKACERNGVPSIQVLTVPATKRGVSIMWRRDLAKYMVKALENESIGEHKIWINDETHIMW